MGWVKVGNIKGIQGNQGIQGIAGAASTVPGPVGPASTIPGPVGPASTVPGPQGAKGDPGASMLWRGAWNSGTTYLNLDAVSYNGSSYVATTTVPSGQAPPDINGSWGLMSSKGEQGEKWYSAAGAPAGATGNVGDWYLDSTNGDYYEKTASTTWTLNGNLKGPIGNTGSQGPTGTVTAAGDGTAAAPGIAFASDTNVGLYRPGADILGFSTNGVARWQIDNNGHLLAATDKAFDIGLTNTNRPRNVIIHGGFYAYNPNVTNDATNWERGHVTWVSNHLRVGTEQGGTGSVRHISISTGGTNRWTFEPTGHLFASTDNQVDIGASGANRPRSIYVGTSVVTPLLDAPLVWLGNGTAAAPSLTFNSDRNTGFFKATEDEIGVTLGGTQYWNFQPGILRTVTDNTTDIGIAGNFRPRNIYVAGSVVTPVLYGPSNVVEMRNGTTAQTFRIYNTYTDASNYARASIFTEPGNALRIASEGAGTGSGGNIRLSSYLHTEFYITGTLRWIMTASTGHLQASPDNAVDIGTATAGRPRNIYQSGGTFQSYNPGAGIANDGTNYERFDVAWAGNTLYLQTAQGGTGVSRNLHVRSTGTGAVTVGGPAGTTSLIGSNIVLQSYSFIEQRNGATAQSYYLYNTTDGTNYERAFIGWSSNTFYLTTQMAGTGLARGLLIGAGSGTDIQFQSGVAMVWRMQGGSGHLLPGAHNSYDIGSATAAPRTIYAATTLQTATGKTVLSDENAGGVIRLVKSTAAAANVGVDFLKLYIRDGTNAGTLKLVVRAGAASAETTVLDNIPNS